MNTIEEQKMKFTKYFKELMLIGVIFPAKKTSTSTLPSSGKILKVRSSHLHNEKTVFLAFTICQKCLISNKIVFKKIQY